jgi:hypothetical protein
MKYSRFRCAKQCATLCFLERHIVIGTPNMAIYNSHLLSRQYCRIGNAVGTTAAMMLLIGACADVKSVFALLSQKVTKAKASFIRITLVYHVPDGANVP